MYRALAFVTKTVAVLAAAATKVVGRVEGCEEDRRFLDLVRLFVPSSLQFGISHPTATAAFQLIRVCVYGDPYQTRFLQNH
ncbi:unnamed protein product [Arabis nemorensis]|uniref:Secreted protein n=1 Tax=Arabis nemorensis TaxID=586526 RepID=A0A565BML1_9BRAS|nr:unnamed protein product [Arabis nemorensis]